MKRPSPAKPEQAAGKTVARISIRGISILLSPPEDRRTAFASEFSGTEVLENHMGVWELDFGYEDGTWEVFTRVLATFKSVRASHSVYKARRQYNGSI